VSFPVGNSLHELIEFDLRSENRYVLHPQGLRRCWTCRVPKPLDEFASKGRRGKNASCKTCENARLALVRAAARRDPERYCRGIVAQLRHRSKVEGCPFDLAGDDLYDAWQSQGGRCYYTGAPLDLTVRAKQGRRPHPDFPSVDRLEPVAGYVAGNIAWCRWAINRAKGDLSSADFVELCAIVAYRLG
jgi:hypothetical protein